MYLKFRFKCFWRKDIDIKAECKMLVKLTILAGEKVEQQKERIEGKYYLHSNEEKQIKGRAKNVIDVQLSRVTSFSKKLLKIS
jgi:hypothetical protein